MGRAAYCEIDGFRFGFNLGSFGVDGVVVDPADITHIGFYAALQKAQEAWSVFEAFVYTDEYYSPGRRVREETDENLKRAIERAKIVLSQHFFTLTKEHLDNAMSVRLAAENELSSRAEAKLRAAVNKRTAATKSTAGYVYLIQSPTGAYKIGRTRNPDDRMKTFGVKLPFEVEYVCLIETDDMVAAERKFHERFASKRVNGEWFDLSDEDVAYMKVVAEVFGVSS